MAWVALVLASLGEVFGVMCINLYLRQKTLGRLLLVVVTFGTGFVFLARAMQDIPISTAYAVWTGLGAAGAVGTGIVFFHEAAGWKRLLFLACIIAGAVGLKLFS
ncbi:MAG TPA: multidrug efflux SMR transporter [Clostridia bacterium]|nr:multidrug efflux SMR transporter [Clostridia bacterium]